MKGTPLTSFPDVVQVKRMVISTYQAASGAGQAAMDELELQTKEVIEGKPVTKNIFPFQVSRLQYICSAFWFMFGLCMIRTSQPMLSHLHTEACLHVQDVTINAFPAAITAYWSKSVVSQSVAVRFCRAQLHMLS